MKGGKGGMGRSGGKPNRGGKPAGKPGAGPKGGAGAAAKFVGKPKRGEAKAGFGGRSSADDATRPERPARNTSRPPVAAARPPRGADTAPAAASSASSSAAAAAAPAPTRGAISVQRTLNVPASAVIRAINDTDRRGWSPEPLYRVMSVLAPRFIRVAFPDGSLAAFSVNRQGNARCTVTVELSKLPDGVDEKQLRDRWAHALAALQEQVDHSWD
jgi:hypothetical protein